MVYEEVVLDMRKANRVRRIGIPREGLVLQPNQLYLGRTVERTETHNFVPMIEGRSSIGRLGLFVHVTAGFGDVGFCGFGRWKCSPCSRCESTPAWPSARSSTTTSTATSPSTSSDKYQHNTDIQPSLLFKELNPECDKDPQLKLPFGMERSHG